MRRRYRTRIEEGTAMGAAGQTSDDGSSWRLRPERVSWRQVDEEIVALDLQTSEYLAVNPTARILWEALAEGSELAALVVLVCERYPDAPVEQVRTDVEVLLNELHARELVTRIEP